MQGYIITCRATGCRIICDELITCRVTGNRGGYIQGPERVVRELGPEEEGLRGGGGEERGRLWWG